MKTIKAAKWGYIITSVIFCLTGILVILYPEISVTLFCCLLGALLIAAGIFKIIGYFSEDLFCLAFRYDFAFGLLLIAIGVIIFIKCGEAAAYLTSGFGWIILLDSFFKV